MIDKETFKRDYIRMMDSVRGVTYKGKPNCKGVYCGNCPIDGLCQAQMAFDIIEEVEQWAKEHPIVTYAGKFKEVFGREPRLTSGGYLCPSVCTGGCSNRNKVCDICKENFWTSEYKDPNAECDKEKESES